MTKIQVNSQGKAYMTTNGKVLLANEGGSTPTLITKSITENGTYSASSDNADGYSSVTVNVNGSTPVIESLSVIPTTSSQTITPPSGTDGYSPINVAAVTSSIDSNITASNIKKDITILGVTGSYEGSGSFISIPREVKNGVYQMPTENFTFNLPSDATNVGKYGLAYAFYGCTRLTSINLSSLTSVGNYSLFNAFRDCTRLTSINLSSLTSVGDYSLYRAFTSCTGLTSINLSSLTSAGDSSLFSAFSSCTGLTSINLSSLTSVGSSGLSSAFSSCTGLTSINLSSLTSVGSSGLSSAFSSCTSLTDIYFRALTTSSFGSYKNQFSGMMNGTSTSVTHTIHFPSNLESTISGLQGYPLFSGISSYVVCAFDLPATS